MKRFETLVTCTFACLFFTAVLVSGCRKNTKDPGAEAVEMSPKSIPKVLYGASLGHVKLPDGTTTEVINGGSTVRFTFPEGIVLAGRNAQGVLVEAMATEYTCTGDCTKGCDVLYAAGSFGCSSCNPATITCTGKSKSFTDVEEAGFLNLNAGISIVRNKEEAARLFAGPDVLFRIPRVHAAMKAFNLKVHGTENPDFSNPARFREIAINLFGCLATYLVPVDSRRGDTEIQLDDALEAASWSCRCDAPAGSSGCTKDSGIGYKRCESGACVSCTMIMN